MEFIKRIQIKGCILCYLNNMYYPEACLKLVNRNILPEEILVYGICLYEKCENVILLKCKNKIHNLLKYIEGWYVTGCF